MLANRLGCPGVPRGSKEVKRDALRTYRTALPLNLHEPASGREMDPRRLNRRGAPGVTIRRELARIRERFGRPSCSLTEERFMIDDHDAVARLEQEVNVAGSSLAVAVDSQKRCFN